MVPIMTGLSSCYHLRHLDLGQCILTDCLTYLFDSTNNDRLADLSDLHLPETMLSAGDLKSISVAVRSNIIPRLCSLVMSGNILTNSLHQLLGGNEHRGFPSLQVLDLTNTALLERDLSCLFGALRHGKCTVLKELKFQPTTLIGCLDDFVNSGIERKKLSLKNAGLSETDVRILRTAAQNDRFHLLKQLDLSGNILTGYVENVMEEIGSDLFGFPSLEFFDLTDTRLCEGDLRYLATISVPKLKCLHLSNTNLEKCVKYFRTLELPSLKVLFLSNTHLTKNDIQSLSLMLQNNTMSLEALDLWDNILTNNLENLFPSGQLSLKWLWLCATSLRKTDMQCLSRKLSRLVHLDLSDNTLKDCTADLFTSGKHAMRTLNLEKTHMTKDDIVNLIRGLSRCQNLRSLYLSHNVLTNCVRHILESCDQSLEILQLNDSKLDKQDIKRLAEYFGEGKLPALQELTLEMNSFDHSDFENLFRCIVEKSRWQKLQVYLSFKELSEMSRNDQMYL